MKVRHILGQQDNYFDRDNFLCLLRNVDIQFVSVNIVGLENNSRVTE